MNLVVFLIIFEVFKNVRKVKNVEIIKNENVFKSVQGLCRNPIKKRVIFLTKCVTCRHKCVCVCVFVLCCVVIG